MVALMPRSLLAAVVVLAAALLSVPSPAPAADQKLPVPEIERIVRDYLLREPEVVYQAIQELQKRQQAEEASRQKEMIAAKRDDIFHLAGDPSGGNVTGDVTLVEFFDYHCGYCRSMAPSLRALLAQDQKLRFVFKDLPVLGPDSVTAAKVAVAASKLDPSRYQSLHFALMQSKDLSKDAVLAIAAKQGYDRGRLEAEMDSDWVKARIESNLTLANTLGVNGTPSFVIGDTLIPGATDITHLAELIDQQRRQAAN